MEVRDLIARFRAARGNPTSALDPGVQLERAFVRLYERDRQFRSFVGECVASLEKLQKALYIISQYAQHHESCWLHQYAQHREVGWIHPEDRSGCTCGLHAKLAALDEK